MQVDTEVNPLTRRRFEKAGYLKVMPTLLLFRDRKMFHYKGPWDVKSLTEFATTNYTEVGGWPRTIIGYGLAPPNPFCLSEIFKV